MSEEKPQEYPPQQESPPQQGYPPQPGYPIQPVYPTQPGYPTQPVYPTQPGYPTQQPGYPTQQPDPALQPPYPPKEQPGYPAGPGPPGTEPSPPAYGAYPPQQAGPQTVVVSTVHSTVVNQFRDSPANVQCPNCHNNVTSNMTHENGNAVILMIVLIACLFQLWCGCCLIPLCINELKDVRHTCPVCSYQLGLYKRL